MPGSLSNNTPKEDLEKPLLTVESESADSSASDFTEHKMSLTSVEQKYRVSFSKGLSQSDAQVRLEEHGPNRMTAVPMETPFQRFLRLMKDPFIYLLLAAGILSLISFFIQGDDSTDLVLGLVLFLVTFLTVLIAFVQEGRVVNVMSKFEGLLPSSTLVFREGSERIIPSIELVVGDRIEVTTGEKIPADVRVFKTNSARVDCSSLTGETVPISLSIDAVSDEAMHANNIAFGGNLCVAGSFQGIVIRTGDNTIMADIAKLASTTKEGQSTLKYEVEYFVNILAVIALSMGTVFFIIALIRQGFSIDLLVNSFIVIIVANVPQGLPAAVSGALVVAARTMLERNVLIKKVDIIETLGSVTVIASDKTGTLTQNVMSVSELWANEMLFGAASVISMAERINDDCVINESALSNLIKCASLCNMSRKLVVASKEESTSRKSFESEVSYRPSSPNDLHRSSMTRLVQESEAVNRCSEYEPKIKHCPTSSSELQGNASDVALYVFGDQFTQVSKLREQMETVFEIPFSSDRKWMLSIHLPHMRDSDQRLIIFFKGAPERVVPLCSSIMRRDIPSHFDDHSLQKFQSTIKSFARDGKRVLGFATARLPESFTFGYQFDYSESNGPNFPLENLCFLGCVSLSDSPKPSVPPTILRCRAAGVKVIMVTGDHPDTAEAIAKECNIMGLYHNKEDPKKQGSIVVTGDQMRSFDEKDWDRVLAMPEIVFARTKPQDKLKIVEELQARGEIVAVTGDGVNDAPALKKADVGIAMGLRGTEVSKDAADVILLDDEFESITKGIEQGRIVFDNLRKSITYILSHLLPEVSAIIFATVLGMPMGLTSAMILAIDLFTEAGPMIALAYEAPEKNVMDRPPRDIKHDRLVNRSVILYAYLQAGVIEAVVCVAAYLSVFSYYNIPWIDLYNTNHFMKGCGEFTLSNGNPISEDEQLKRVSQAQTAFFAALVLAQCLSNAFVCKTQKDSLKKKGLFNNIVLNYGVIVGVGMLVFFIFVPSMKAIFNTDFENEGFIWVPFLISAVALFAWGEFRKYLFRRRPESVFSQMFS